MKPKVTQDKRPIQEPGGFLLIGLGMDRADLEKAIACLIPLSSSLTVLVDGPAAHAARAADEIWVYGPLGLRGFMALMRRISWRRFEAVYQPRPAPKWLKFLVWPRPDWHGDLPAHVKAG